MLGIESLGESIRTKYRVLRIESIVVLRIESLYSELTRVELKV